MKYLKIVNADYIGRADVIRHACRGIVVKQGKILLSYEQNIDQYLIPGGGVEGEESLADCCKREVLEETGFLCVPRVNYLDIEEWFKNWNHINHYFICEVVGEGSQVKLTASEKAVGLTYVWKDVSDALEIFSKYEQYENIDVTRFGLYRREFLAIQAYLEYLKIELSAMAVVVCGDKILATNEIIYGNNVLSLPKGHKEEGETLVETAIRECFEETGVVLTENNLVKELPSFSYEFFTPTNEMIRKTIVPLLFNVAVCDDPLHKEKRIMSVQWMKISEFLEKCKYQNVKDVVLKIC